MTNDTAPAVVMREIVLPPLFANGPSYAPTHLVRRPTVFALAGPTAELRALNREPGDDWRSLWAAGATQTSRWTSR